MYSWFCRRLPDERLPRTRSGWLQHTEPLQNPIMNVTAELYDWVFDNVTNTTYEVERPDLGGCFGQGPGQIHRAASSATISDRAQVRSTERLHLPLYRIGPRSDPQSGFTCHYIGQGPGQIHRAASPAIIKGGLPISLITGHQYQTPDRNVLKFNGDKIA